MTRVNLETIAKIIIGLIAVFLILSIVWSAVKSTKSPIVEFIDKTIFGEKEELEKVEVSDDLPFYNEFVKNYQECKLSPDTECSCPFTNPSTPDNYVIELQNQNGKTIILLHGNAQVKDCILAADFKSLKTIATNIDNDILYFEDVYTFPIVESGKLQLSDFGLVDKLYLYKNELCSVRDVKGDNAIDFKKGFIYKFGGEFDSQKTALSSALKTKKCEIQKDITPAYNAFNLLVSTINECKDQVCLFQIKDNKGESTIPKDFTLSIKDKKIVLEYKSKEVKSEVIKKDVCLYTHYSSQVRQNLELGRLELNDYYQLEIYSYESKICFLPYTPNLIKQKLSEELKAKAIIPN